MTIMQAPIPTSMQRNFVYPFFLVHMLAFGSSGFFMAYGSDHPDISFLYMHGGFAIFVYLVFYFVLFGVDEVKWIFINAALGFYGILAEIGWVLALFDRKVSDFPYYVHAIPFLYYILYTFLLRQAVLDFTGSIDNPGRKRVVEGAYVTVSAGVYTGLHFLST